MLCLCAAWPVVHCPPTRGLASAAAARCTRTRVGNVHIILSGGRRGTGVRWGAVQRVVGSGRFEGVWVWGGGWEGWATRGYIN